MLAAAVADAVGSCRTPVWNVQSQNALYSNAALRWEALMQAMSDYRVACDVGLGFVWL